MLFLETVLVIGLVLVVLRAPSLIEPAQFSDEGTYADIGFAVDHGASATGAIAGWRMNAGSIAEGGSLPLGVRSTATSPFGPIAIASGFAG